MKTWTASLVLGLILGIACPLHALADSAGLRAKHDQLQAQLRDNPYGRAMHIDSNETPDALQGDIHAVLEHPFARVREALKEPDAWCDIMILPFNTKYCRAMGDDRVVVRIGRKYNQPVDQAFRLVFDFKNTAASDDYLESRLDAAQGPFGTRNYRIRVEAVPLGGERTFLHLSYSYAVGATGRMAMQAYLATAGADKVGFSTTRDANGRPVQTGGVRGAVERNAMRYYLAIDAYLDSLQAPESDRAEKRIQDWFSATERYPRQLREMDRSTYVNMKRTEIERQHTAALQ